MKITEAETKRAMQDLTYAFCMNGNELNRLRAHASYEKVLRRVLDGDYEAAAWLLRNAGILDR